jgi:hypothetical protein
LDEALGLSIGARRIWSGSDVTQGEGAASIAKGQGSVATAVVGHYARDLDDEAFIVGDCGVEKRHGALLGVIRHDLDEGDAGGVVDADMDELPADAAIMALASAIAGDAVADSIELFNVDGSNRRDDRARTAGSARQVPVHLAC